MKFDTLIIGGGLAGLITGIKIQKSGKKCAIVSGGQCALHFSSGSLDLLHTLPDGSVVRNPEQELNALMRQSEKHPYTKIGQENFVKYVREVPQLLSECGVSVIGSSVKNSYRMTPMGEFAPTWLTLEGCPVVEDNSSLPWKNVCVFNIKGFLDFYPDFIAAELSKLGVTCKIHEFTLPAFEDLRSNPSEMRSVNLARTLKKCMYDDAFIQILSKESENSNAVIFPALVDLDDVSKFRSLFPQAPEIYFLPTMPPSVVGISLYKKLQNYYKKLGGVFMSGDSVVSSEVKDDEVNCVYTSNHGDIALRAHSYVLASGGIFSKGIVASTDMLYEPLFGVDVDFLANRKDWYNKNVFDKQAYQSFGIKTDNYFKALIQGKPVKNLYVVGAGLEGFNPIKEGSGAGVSMLTGLSVADTIIKGENNQ